ncbi:hypothetical protein Hte_003263 [Hypoxylon texense]
MANIKYCGHPRGVAARTTRGERKRRAAPRPSAATRRKEYSNMAESKAESKLKPNDGVCAFTQQGCKHKHEMAFDKAPKWAKTAGAATTLWSVWRQAVHPGQGAQAHLQGRKGPRMAAEQRRRGRPTDNDDDDELSQPDEKPSSKKRGPAQGLLVYGLANRAASLEEVVVEDTGLWRPMRLDI